MAIDPARAPALRYSFCTLVTDMAEYRAMVRAFADKGFGAPDCEFLFIDNTAGRTADAFAGYNAFLLQARGAFVVLCHQDILPIADGRARLDGLLDALGRRHPDWGLCGNAGYTAEGSPVFCITDPRGEHRHGHPLPRAVVSLDENFIVARREANLALSRDLDGFHWYGSDLCLIAATLGWGAYVIDFHLRHASGGTLDQVFEAKRFAFKMKYRHAFRPRWQFVPTDRPVFLASSRAGSVVAKGLLTLRLRLRRMRARIGWRAAASGRDGQG